MTEFPVTWADRAKKRSGDIG